jgi:hypothetical protein
MMMMNKRKLKQVLNCQGGILTTLHHRANSLQVKGEKLADRADDHEERIAVLEAACKPDGIFVEELAKVWKEVIDIQADVKKLRGARNAGIQTMSDLHAELAGLQKDLKEFHINFANSIIAHSSRAAAIESTISGLQHAAQHAACETANEITGLAALIAALGERVVELADRLRAVETAREVLLHPPTGTTTNNWKPPEEFSLKAKVDAMIEALEGTIETPREADAHLTVNPDSNMTSKSPEKLFHLPEAGTIETPYPVCQSCGVALAMDSYGILRCTDPANGIDSRMMLCPECWKRTTKPNAFPDLTINGTVRVIDGAAPHAVKINGKWYDAREEADNENSHK